MATTQAGPAPVQQPAELDSQPAQQQQYAPYNQHQNPNPYGQPFQPYAQYGSQNVPAGQQTQPPQTVAPQHVEAKGWVFTKLGMHAALLIIQIIILGITFSIIGKGLSGSVESTVVVFCCPLPIVAMFWSATELIVRSVRKFQTGVHPGAHVGMCLIIWIIASIVGGTFATMVAISQSYCNEDVYYSSNYSDECSGQFIGSVGSFWAITVFTWLTWLFYFILFIFACIDTARRNATKRQPIMIVNPSYWGPAMQGWEQMPQNAAPHQNGQWMAVPQVPHNSQQTNMSGANQGQDIPMVNRTPSPMTTNQTTGDVEKGKGSSVTEFYTPGPRAL